MINGSSYYQLRPTGENKEDYEGCRQWSNKQWAWEFLRRNRKFQEWCHKIENSNLSKKLKNRQARKEYGLQRYKSYAEPYKGDGVNQAKFLTSDIISWSRITAMQQKNKPLYPKIPLRQGEVIIKFSVLASLKSTKSIDAQLRAAKKLLLQRKGQWSNRKKKIPPNDSKHKLNLPDLLRLLDARDYNICKHSNSQAQPMKDIDIYVKIFPHKKPKENKNPKENEKKRGEVNELTILNGEYKKMIEAADNYTTNRYLDLAATADKPRK